MHQTQKAKTKTDNNNII